MEIKTLSSDEIIKSVSVVKNGQMCRIKYKSEMPVKAEFKKQGIKIVKVTEATIRFGVDYEHISTVIERKSNEDYTPAVRANNYEWVIENKICHNSKTGKDCVRFATLNGGAHKKVVYIVVDSLNETYDIESLTEEQKKYIQDSYWNRTTPEVQNILFENIIAIGSNN